jgi:hypothetical protein
MLALIPLMGEMADLGTLLGFLFAMFTTSLIGFGGQGLALLMLAVSFGCGQCWAVILIFKQWDTPSGTKPTVSTKYAMRSKAKLSYDPVLSSFQWSLRSPFPILNTY